MTFITLTAVGGEVFPRNYASKEIPGKTVLVVCTHGGFEGKGSDVAATSPYEKATAVDQIWNMHVLIYTTFIRIYVVIVFSLQHILSFPSWNGRRGREVEKHCAKKPL